MTPERQVYLLDPQSLPPETIAVTFAKTSRSPLSFREIAAELTDEKSAEFHEKWVVGYGHSSVAEHAVLHVAVENVSRLAIESLESNRLASYTEKSTRYQTWNPENYYVPSELDGHPLRQTYIDTCSALFMAYQASIDPVKGVVAQRIPPKPGESERRWDQRVRSEYVDACRFLLPAASLANVGITINARALEHAIQKLLSHPLEEVRSVGLEIKQVSQAEAPTLVKYADAVPYLERSRQIFTTAAKPLEASEQTQDDWCRLVRFDADSEKAVLAAALYRFGAMSYLEAVEMIERMTMQEQQNLAKTLLGQLDRYDIPLRELEYASYTFDVLLDQGAYFELKRHRMMTQTPQALTTRLGYAVPRLIIEAGLEENYCQSMEMASQAYEMLYEFTPEVASYVVPNAYNRRVLLTMNLRSAAHLINLRTASNAHFSIRRIARRMAEQIQDCTPLLGCYLQQPAGETWQQIEAEHLAFHT
jgi:thymidylate synthase ThyX